MQDITCHNTSYITGLFLGEMMCMYVSIPLSVQTLENWSHASACRPNQI